MLRVCFISHFSFNKPKWLDNKVIFLKLASLSSSFVLFWKSLVFHLGNFSVSSGKVLYFTRGFWFPIQVFSCFIHEFPCLMHCFIQVINLSCLMQRIFGFIRAFLFKLFACFIRGLSYSSDGIYVFISEILLFHSREHLQSVARNNGYYEIKIWSHSIIIHC